MEEGLSIVLPAFNEEANIRGVIHGIISHIRKYMQNFEIIVVNDGSTDSTLKILNEIKILYPEIKSISHEKNKGYGCAIRTGIKFSQKDWIFIIDSDGQFKIEDFLSFWEKKTAYDFILGYRMVRKDTLYRRWLGSSGNYLGNLFLEKRIRDINCGFKIFRLRELKKITLISTGGCIYFEILFYLLKSGKRSLQLPLRHYERMFGKQTGGGFKNVAKILREGTRVVFGKQAKPF